MTRRLLALTLVASALSACQVGGDTERFVPTDRCTPIQGACGSNADCCSYGCMSGVCVPNPVPGGVCRTSDDCGVVMDATGFHYMGCKSGACTTDVVCRDDADVCDSDNDCCSGNCVGATWSTSGTCTANSAPAVELGPDREIPYSRTTTLAATVSDPDATDTLVYGWTLVAAPPGSTAAISAPTAATPTFVPNVPGAYRFRLAVTDGQPTQRSRLTTTDEVTLIAINTAPVVDPGPGSSHASRNVVQTLSAQVSDPDLDPLTCTWKVSSPTRAEQTVAGPAPCSGSFSASFTCDVQETWTATIVATDGVNTTSGAAAYECVNDAPVAEAGPTRYGNLGATAETTSPIPLVGTASDVNADAPLDYVWSLDAKPATSGLVVGSTLGTALTVAFVPDVEGQYVLRLRAADPQGAAGSDTVTVEVHRHIRELPHDVVDAEYARDAARLVMVGHDPANAAKGALWVLDPAAASAAETSVALDTSPTSVAVTADGARAVVADDVYVRRVSLGATPAVSSDIAPFSVRDVAVVGASDAYLFPFYQPYPAIQPHIRAYDLSNGAFTETYEYGNAGVGDPVLANVLYAADDEWGELTRYTSSGRGALSQSHADYGYSCPSGRIWAAQNGGHVFSSCGDVYVASTLVKSLKILPYGIDHLHSAATSGEVALLSGAATSIQRFTASFDPLSSEALPYWADSGNGSPCTGSFVFISADGKTRWAIVRASVAGVWKTGLVTFTSP